MKIKVECHECNNNVILEKKDIKIMLFRKKGYIFQDIDYEPYGLWSEKRIEKTYKLNKNIFKNYFKCIGCGKDSLIEYFYDFELIKVSKLIKELKCKA